MIALHEVSKVFNQGQPNEECRALREAVCAWNAAALPYSRGRAGPAKPRC
ncbi:MAG: hypothetical protein R3F36_09735 [Candidatus Competibacteraceae bacterium]